MYVRVCVYVNGLSAFFITFVCVGVVCVRVYVCVGGWVGVCRCMCVCVCM